jgi:hypothetical protein
MRAVPNQHLKALQYEDIKISEIAKQQLNGLGYEEWLKTQNQGGSYRRPEAKYDPSTVKEFLIHYRKEKQKKWDTARFGRGIEASEFRWRNLGYEASDGNNLAKYNILSSFANYTDKDIRKLSTENLNLFLNRLYNDKNRDFNDVNRSISFQGVNYDTHSHTQTISSWSMSNFFKKLFGNSEKESVKNIEPLNQPPAIRRASSMSINYKVPNHWQSNDSEGTLGKRKRCDPRNSGLNYYAANTLKPQRASSLPSSRPSSRPRQPKARPANPDLKGPARRP